MILWGFRVECPNMALYETRSSTMRNVTSTVSEFHLLPKYIGKVIASTRYVALDVKPIKRKLTFFRSFPLLPIFFKASRNKTSVEHPESISTPFM